MTPPHGVVVRQSAVRHGEIGIFLQRLLEVGYRLGGWLRASLIPQITAAQVGVVGLWIRRVLDSSSRLFCRDQPAGNLVRNRQGQVLFQPDHLSRLSLVSFRPQVFFG
jgi:hypothetical protein